MRNNKKNLLWIALMCLSITITSFYFTNIRIPQIEESIRTQIDINSMPKQKVAVVYNEVITKYTQLTEDIIQNNIKIVYMPVDFVVPNAISDVDIIRNRITKEDLRPGEQITGEELSTEKKWFKDYDRLKEYKVSTIVANEVNQGNIVDIVVNYGNGTFDVVVPKTKVRKLIKHLDKNNNKEVYTLVFAVDTTNEVSYKDLQLASKLGILETRLYIDESQNPSIKTFNYEQMSKHIKPINKIKDDNSQQNAIQGNLKVVN